MKIATRESYGHALVQFAEAFPNMVVLDADLTGATKTNMFQKAYPDRHINFGISEANMMGVAAGLATEGLIPVVSTFAIFAAGRAWEQARNSVAYPELNVKICATHGGVSVGEDGASHQCIEDLALMRVIPNMTVLCPSDDIEAKAALHAALSINGPVYLRFGRLATEVFNTSPDYSFEIGKAIPLRKGGDVTIIATGLCVWESLKAAEILGESGIEASVINMHTIKPIDVRALHQAALTTGKIVTVEEHSIIGGLGSAVAEILSEICPVPMMRIGVRDVFGESGTALQLLEKHNLTSARIANETMHFLRRQR